MTATKTTTGTTTLSAFAETLLQNLHIKAGGLGKAFENLSDSEKEDVKSRVVAAVLKSSDGLIRTSDVDKVTILFKKVAAVKAAEAAEAAAAAAFSKAVAFQAAADVEAALAAAQNR